MKLQPELRWWKRNWRCKLGSHYWRYGYIDGTWVFVRQCEDCLLTQEAYHNGRSVNERLGAKLP